MQIAALSVDQVEDSAALAADLGLNFPLLSDPDRRIIQAYGVDDLGNEIAWPALFIVDRQGHIVWRHIADNYSVRKPVGEVLAAARSVARRR